MSAIAEPGERNEPIRILFTLHEGFDTLDFAGPLEILESALHDPKDPSKTQQISLPQWYLSILP